MSFIGRLRVRTKLLLLAGIPILGIVTLTALIISNIQDRTRAAAGLGSINDLARLTEKILYVIDALQHERSEAAYQAGGTEPTPPEPTDFKRRTDAALEELDSLLHERDPARLPVKLRQDLDAAHQRLQSLPQTRARRRTRAFDLLEYLNFFAQANDSLIRATAALTQLSDDKQLLLSIGGLVSAMQVIERGSREAALLGYVFGKQEFPPGSFRYFVSLITEQDVYADSLRTWASEQEFQRLKADIAGPEAAAIASMRRLALETTEGTLPVQAARWHETQTRNMDALSRVERAMMEGVKAVSGQKIAAAARAVQATSALVTGVVLAALIIGWSVTRGLTRSVRALYRVASDVNDHHDFSVRAESTSRDELGVLTDAFNGMLAGLQARETELDVYRKHLEALVEARTRELSERNAQMRLVLDNVAEGLAIIDREGRLIGETSRSFDQFFGKPAPGAAFHAIIGANERDQVLLEFGYEQLMANVLSVNLALAQLPGRIEHGGRHYALTLRPILDGRTPSGALVVTRDVTLELEAQRLEAEQRERVLIFERIMRDRWGFQEFISEAEQLLGEIQGYPARDRQEVLRQLHTLKGLAALFDVHSVSKAAHELERVLLEDLNEPSEAAREQLAGSWRSFRRTVDPLCSAESLTVEMSPVELEQLIDAVRATVPHGALLRSLVRFRWEPVVRRFERMGDQLRRMAGRLGKPEPVVVIEAGEVRLPPDVFRSFWGSLAHVVRNIADHGLESEEQRALQGKPVENHVRLSAREAAEEVLIEISDDGRGVDWDRVAQRASELGLREVFRSALSEALFADGLSTADGVTQTSGRGIGLAAVRAACQALGGVISVDSERGRGTTFRFCFPKVARLEPDGFDVLLN